MFLTKRMFSFGHCRRESKILPEQQCRDGCWRSSELCCSGSIGYIAVTTSIEVFAQQESHQPRSKAAWLIKSSSCKGRRLKEKKVGTVDFAVCSLIGSLNRMNGSMSGLHGDLQ